MLHFKVSLNYFQAEFEIIMFITHWKVSEYARAHDIECEIVMNINQGDMKIMAVDLSKREIISIT